MSGREVMAEIVDAEFDALSDVNKSLIVSLTSSNDLDPFGFAANVIKGIFPGSLTLAALASVRVETISRAVELGIDPLTEKRLKLESIR